MTPGFVIRKQAPVQIHKRQMAAPVMMVTLAPRAIVASRERASDRIRSRVQQVINVTMPERAMRRPGSVRIRKKRMAVCVMTVTLVPRPILARRGYASAPIRSRVARAINVTMRAHAIRKPECAQIRRRQTAPAVTTAMLVRKPTVVSPEYALGPTQSSARRAINVTTPGLAIRKRELVQIQRNRMEVRAATAMHVPKPTPVSRERVLAQIL